MAMKRMNFYLADMQIRRLKAINKKTGLPLSDILRRAIDEYWEKFEREGEEVKGARTPAMDGKGGTMKRYRYFCWNCFEKEGKEVSEILKRVEGLKPSQYLHKKCEICKQEMELQEEVIGTGRQGDVSLGWRKL